MRVAALGALCVVAAAAGLAIALAFGDRGTRPTPMPPVAAPRTSTYAIAGLARLSADPPIPRFLLERAAPPRRRVVRHRPRPRPRLRPRRVVVSVPARAPASAPVVAAAPRPVVRAAPARKPFATPRPSPRPAQPPVVFDDSG